MLSSAEEPALHKLTNLAQKLRIRPDDIEDTLSPRSSRLRSRSMRRGYGLPFVRTELSV